MLHGKANPNSSKHAMRDFLKDKPVPRRCVVAYEFDHTAAEIAILDAKGRTIWHKKKWESDGPIRWEGVDSHGKIVEGGDYICKVLYPDGETRVVPFVLLKAG